MKTGDEQVLSTFLASQEFQLIAERHRQEVWDQREAALDALEKVRKEQSNRAPVLAKVVEAKLAARDAARLTVQKADEALAAAQGEQSVASLAWQREITKNEAFMRESCPRELVELESEIDQLFQTRRHDCFVSQTVYEKPHWFAEHPAPVLKSNAAAVRRWLDFITVARQAVAELKQINTPPDKLKEYVSNIRKTIRANIGTTLE